MNINWKAFISGLIIIILCILIGIVSYMILVPNNIINNIINNPNAVDRSKEVVGIVKNDLPFLNGVNLVNYSSDAGAKGMSSTFIQQDSLRSLNQLYNNNARYAEIVLRGNVDSTNYLNISPDKTSLNKDDLLKLIGNAKKEGITPILKPHLFVDGKSDSREVIGESWGINDTDIEQKWFDSYYNYILDYVQISETQNLPMFVIATELPGLVLDNDSTNGRRALEWKSLISKIRSIYKGKLTYAANSTSAYKIAWWGSLDYIGIDAYYTLTDKDNPSYEEIKAGWMSNTMKRTKDAFGLPKETKSVNIVSLLGELSNKYNKPIIFTEIGYRSADAGVSHINDGKIKWAKQPLNLTLQSNAIKVLLEEFLSKPWFKGMFLWSWYNGIPDTKNETFMRTHIIQDKPAESIMKEHYSQFIK